MVARRRWLQKRQWWVLMAEGVPLYVSAFLSVVSGGGFCREVILVGCVGLVFLGLKIESW